MSSLRQAGARRHRVVGTVVGRLVRVLACCMPAGAIGCMPAPAPLDCTHAGGTPMLEYQLFFGRGIPGRTDLTDREWAEFAEQVVTPNLPDGFTAFDADGQWRNPRTGKVVRETTKVIVVAVPDTEAARSAIATVKDTYRSRFHQQLVGTVSHAACGAF
jgi:hypothetical protein